MPNIADILADNPGGVVGLPKASGSAPYIPGYIGPPGRNFGEDANAALVRQAGLEVGAAAARVATALEEAETAKRAIRAKTEAAALQADLELDLAKGTTALRNTVSDPEEYLDKARAQITELQNGLKDRTTNADALAVLSAKLPAIFGRHEAEAYKHSNDLFVQGEEGRLVRTLDAKRNLAGLTPLDDDAAFADHYRDAVGAIKAVEPVIGRKRAAEMIVKTRQEMVEERARRYKDFDPAGFLEIGDQKFAGMDPKARDLLMESARSRVDALERQRTAATEKWFKDVEEQAETERKAQVDALESRALSGKLNLPELEQFREMRIATGDDYRRLRRHIESPSDRPSDPDTAKLIGLDVNSISPRTSEKDIDAAVDAGKLNLKDAIAFKNRLRETREGLINEDKAKWRTYHAQAEQEIRAALDITGLIDRYDPNDERHQLYFMALSELRTRSLAYQGKEDPLEAGQRIAERYRIMRERTVKLSADRVEQTLRYPTREALEGQRRFITPAEYELELRKFSELDRAREREARRPTTQTGLGKERK